MKRTRTSIKYVLHVAEWIILVMDNLNTHTPVALYGTFPPAEARVRWRNRIKERLTYRPSSIRERWRRLARPLRRDQANQAHRPGLRRGRGCWGRVQVPDLRQ